MTLTETPFRKARKRLTLSLAQLSAQVGYDRGGLSRIERGKTQPRPALAVRLAAILGITRDEIMFPEEYVGKRSRTRKAGAEPGAVSKPAGKVA